MIIRRFENEDTLKVIHLLSGSYPSIGDVEDWSHIYVKGPAGKASIFVAEDKKSGIIVGHYAIVKKYFSVFGKKCLAAKGQGEVYNFGYLKHIVSKGVEANWDIPAQVVKCVLESAANEGLCFVMALPADQTLKPHLQAGCKILESVSSVFLLILKRKYAEHFFSPGKNTRKWAGLLSGAAFWLTRGVYFLESAAYRAKNVALERVAHFDESVDSLVNLFYSACDCVAVDRNHKYLNWRFEKRSFKKYIVKVDQRPVGYAVMHIFTGQDGFREAALVDYLVLPSYADRFGAMIVRIEGEAVKEGCDLLRVNYLHDIKDRFGFAGCLERLRFTRNRSEQNIVLKVFLPMGKESISGMTDAGNWYFTDLDFEEY